MKPEPADFVFDEVAEAAVSVAIARYPAAKQASAVMSLLDIVQRQMARQTGSAWVPRIAMDVVATTLVTEARSKSVDGRVTGDSGSNVKFPKARSATSRPCPVIATEHAGKTRSAIPSRNTENAAAKRPS